MRLQRIATELTLIMATLAATCGAAERPRIVREATSFESGGKEIHVTVYRPDDGGKHPTIVYLHGGGNSFRDPVMDQFHVEMARRGLVVVAPHWHVDGTGWPDWQKTATKAVTFAVSLPNVDADHIGMAGLSMGGQTGLSTAARDRRIMAVAEFFTAWPGSMPDEPIEALPPVLLLNGTADPVIPFDKAIALDGILKAHHLPFERHVYEGLGHGFSTAASFKDAVIRTAVFFGGTAEPTGSNPVTTTSHAPLSALGNNLDFDDDEFDTWGEFYAWSTRAKATLGASKKKQRRGRVATSPETPHSAESAPKVAKP